MSSWPPFGGWEDDTILPGFWASSHCSGLFSTANLSGKGNASLVHHTCY